MCCVRVSAAVQSDGCTPLYVASEKGHMEVVRALMVAGAGVNQARVREDWGGCWCSGVRGCLVFGSQPACTALPACVVLVECAWRCV